MMHGRMVGRLALVAGAWVLAAGAGGEVNAKETAPAAHWHTLFDGKLLDTFRGWRAEGMPEGWHVVDGTLVKEGDVDDLVTKEQFGNFELELEWKIGKGGNSGVFYRATREYDHIYWSGPEYQLLDDANAGDGRSRLTAAASAYALYGPPAGVVKPFGEWNKTRILVNGDHVEHWLNGTRVLSYDTTNPAIQAALRKMLPKDSGAATPLIKESSISLQNHSSEVWFRNIKIRALP